MDDSVRKPSVGHRAFDLACAAASHVTSIGVLSRPLVEFRLRCCSDRIQRDLLYSQGTALHDVSITQCGVGLND